MISNLFILSSTGEVIIEKHWRGKVKRTIAELFWEEVSKAPSKTEVNPVIVTPKHYLINVHRYDLFFLTICDREVTPLIVFEAQHRIIDVFLDYLGGKLSETMLKENFSVVLQLLDEMIDGGFPATMEPNQLKEMILPPTLTQQVLQKMGGNFAVNQELPQQNLSKIPWRKAECKYVTNEIYFDIVEQIDCIIGSNQNVIYSSVYGEIKSNCQLSGMPDLTLTFNRPSVLEDASLHRCVRINRFLKEKTVSFVPPDGNFKLLTYRVPGQANLPIYVKPIANYSKAGSGRIHIQVGPKNTGDKPITDVVLILPLPANLSNSALTANVGNIRIDTKTKVLRWEIGRIPKEKTPTLEGTVSLPHDFVPEEIPTVRVEFSVKMWSTTGLKVDGLAIRNVKYRPFKGVRSVTTAGRFQVRCATS